MKRSKLDIGDRVVVVKDGILYKAGDTGIVSAIYIYQAHVDFRENTNSPHHGFAYVEYDSMKLVKDNWFIELLKRIF